MDGLSLPLDKPARPVEVEVFNIELRFGGDANAAPIVSNLSFKVEQGEFLVLVGPSGVGKSTLLRVIAGLVRPQTGDVYVREERRPDRRPLAFVFQDVMLFPWRNVRQNVELGLEGLSISRSERRQRALAALDLVGITDQQAKWPHQLSGGQRQRAGIARALAVRPALLLMDEPFGALDPRTREELQDELLAICASTGSSVVFVTHDMTEATYLGDRVLVLSGRPARLAQDIRIEEPRPRMRERAVGGAMSERLLQTFSSGKEETA